MNKHYLFYLFDVLTIHLFNQGITIIPLKGKRVYSKLKKYEYVFESVVRKRSSKKGNPTISTICMK